MQLPPLLKSALDDELSRHDMASLRASRRRLTERYRAETRDGRRHLADDAAVAAYLAARMPATYAAIRASLGHLAANRPDFCPTTLLDVGAGPGTALWAACASFASLRSATMIEASACALAMGRALASGKLEVATTWMEADITRREAGRLPRGHLVTLAYVLDELAPAQIAGLTERLWEACDDALVIVEPGTPAGWGRILTVRDQLLGLGAHVVAPCPHALTCPVAEPDWCHFSERVERSRTHRLAKDAGVPYEDEKFAYLVVARRPSVSTASRVLSQPSRGKGKVSLKLCRPDGALERRLVTKREGGTFDVARRLEWGDRFE